MRTISEWFGRKRPADGIPPSARPAPYRPAGQYARHPEHVPLNLPAENPDLLCADPRVADQRAERERQREAAALAFEAAVAENVLILRPTDSTAAGYLAVLRAAQAVTR